jgi:hypothetical protein
MTYPVVFDRSNRSLRHIRAKMPHHQQVTTVAGDVIL